MHLASEAPVAAVAVAVATVATRVVNTQSLKNIFKLCSLIFYAQSQSGADSFVFVVDVVTAVAVVVVARIDSKRKLFRPEIGDEASKFQTSS